MKQKMTISEFRNYVQEGVIKLYVNYLLEKESTDVSESSLADEVYAEIETRMRPTDQFLSISEISEIADIYDVDYEEVLNIMQAYVMDRNKAQQEDLIFDIKEILRTLEEEGNQNPSFSEFFQKFKEFEHDYPYSAESVRAEFDKLTKDPNQLSLFERLMEQGLKE